MELGVCAVDPDKVILYGSRARGDAREDSDYDLAFVFPGDRRDRWVRFVVDLDDAAVTLLPVDLLNWNEALRVDYASGFAEKDSRCMSDVPAVENFGKALSKAPGLHGQITIVDDRDRAGIIQAFGIHLRAVLEGFPADSDDQGIAAASPRQALEAAVRLKLIHREDEKEWLDMLHDRNMTSHLYQEAIAVEIAQRVVDRYLVLLDEAHQACA